MHPLVITHGGAAASAAFQDGPEAAARAGLDLLLRGATALDAAVAAAVLLEDDPRFNAGTGSNLRLDGRTIEMDAAVMDSEGDFGAVMAIQRTKNPVLVARDVARTPHLMLAGEGARLFARRLGYADYDPITDRARDKYARWLAQWKEMQAGLDPDAAPFAGLSAAESWRGFDLRAHWNFPEEFRVGDTIGSVARDAAGRFAVTNSSGGTAMMLHGRVGDSPIYAAGLYAGPHGGVAATGEGEEIVRRLLCFRVYERLVAGASAEAAARAELDLVPERIAMGLIVADRTDAWGGSNREMPFAIVEAEE